MEENIMCVNKIQSQKVRKIKTKRQRKREIKEKENLAIKSAKRKKPKKRIGVWESLKQVS